MGALGRTTTNVARGIRSPIALTVADQAVSSASNFVTGVVIARLTGATEFGDYALTLSIWLVVVGLHRALVSEPVIVRSSSDDSHPFLARGVGAELLLGTAVGLVVAAGGLAAAAAGSRVGVLMLALSPWFPVLLVQDYWRAMAFRAGHPGRALINDIVFAAVQFGAIAVFVPLGLRTAPAIITAWGLGATVGALLGFRWFPGALSLREGWGVLRGVWDQSRWMLADFVTSFASDQAFVAFVALLLPRAEYGGFRAAYSLVGPAYVLGMAAGNIGLPGAARRSGPDQRDELHRYARRLTLGTAGSMGVYGLVVAVVARPLLTTVYGPEFAQYAPLVVLGAIWYTILGGALGQITALKATGKIRLLWRYRVLVAIGSLTSLIVLDHELGINGVGWAGVATGCYFALAVRLLYRRELGRPPDPEAPEPTPVATVLPPG
jgi:O-antigen/teichoic acid export membrane protein